MPPLSRESSLRTSSSSTRIQTPRRGLPWGLGRTQPTGSEDDFSFTLSDVGPVPAPGGLPAVRPALSHTAPRREAVGGSPARASTTSAHEETIKSVIAEQARAGPRLVMTSHCSWLVHEVQETSKCSWLDQGAYRLAIWMAGWLELVLDSGLRYVRGFVKDSVCVFLWTVPVIAYHVHDSMSRI